MVEGPRCKGGEQRVSRRMDISKGGPNAFNLGLTAERQSSQRVILFLLSAETAESKRTS